MALTERTKRDLGIVWRIVLGAAVLGAAYTSLRQGLTPVNAGLGALIGIFISSTLSSFELIYVRGRRGEWLRRRQFVSMIGLKSLVYLGIIVASQIAGILLFGGFGDPLAVLLGRGFLWGIVFSYLVTVFFLFILQVNRMLGGQMFANFIGGRYHRPVEEERVFLFVDLEGATATAERIGDLRFLDLLNRFFYDLAAGVTEHRAEIYKYVGDEVIVTWPLAEGVKDGRCIQCYFAILDRIEQNRARYLRDFGLVPSFRAGLHAGRVAAGEMGDRKQEIAYLGDVMNTTARIEQACREICRPFVVSAVLLAQVDLPTGLDTESLGQVTLRGKEEPMELFAVRRTAPVPAEAAA